MTEFQKYDAENYKRRQKARQMLPKLEHRLSMALHDGRKTRAMRIAALIKLATA